MSALALSSESPFDEKSNYLLPIVPCDAINERRKKAQAGFAHTTDTNSNLTSAVKDDKIVELFKVIALALPPLVGSVELMSGKRFEVRRKVEMNEDDKEVNSYLLSLPFNEENLQAYIANEYTQLVIGKIKLIELDTQNPLECSRDNDRYLPDSYKKKKIIYVSSLHITRKEQKQGVGSLLLKVAALHSKKIGNEGRLYLLASLHSPGFYAKNCFETTDPLVNEKIMRELSTGKNTVSEIAMHIPLDKVDQIAQGKVKLFEVTL